MKRRITVIVSLAFVFTARGDYVIKEELENAGQVQQVTLKIKDAKVREDIGGQNSAIIDATTGETTLLLHPQKAFLKISPEQLKEQAKALKDLLGTKAENPGNIELKPTGKRETIKGFATEEYTTNFNGAQLSIFIAKEFPNYQKIVEALYQVQSGPAMDVLRSMSIPPENYPGLPIRTTENIMGQKIVVILDSAEETDLPDTDFAIPSDYKELNPRETGK
jgi:Domain of unknown function (DUF4412)